MSKKEIQIIAFSNPYPPDFGGVIDVFYKIKALHELNVKVHLHYFYDSRNDISGLKPLCESLVLYKKETSLSKHLSFLPFSVASRISSDLIQNLKKRKAPILFESIRTTGVLKKHVFNQITAVRCHNIEHHYSWGLFKSEKKLLRKLAFLIDGYKLKYYESVLNKADFLYTISNFEFNYFNEHFKSNVFYLPVFQGGDKVLSKNGFGKYALYHGDLSIADNIKSALFIIDVFKDLNECLIIASSTRVPKIINEINKHNNISFQIIDNNEQLDSLIKEAQINTLYSFQKSGTKLKVFNALFKGRHCIINTNMIDAPDVLKICEVVQTKEEYKRAVKKMFEKKFLLTQERQNILKTYKAKNVAKILIETMLS